MEAIVKLLHGLKCWQNITILDDCLLTCFLALTCLIQIVIPDIRSMTLRLLPRTLGAQGQRQASFLGGIFGSGEKKAGIATEATFDYHPYKLHQLDEGPATTTTITRDEALRIYREMVTIRYNVQVPSDLE